MKNWESTLVIPFIPVWRFCVALLVILAGWIGVKDLFGRGTDWVVYSAFAVFASALVVYRISARMCGAEWQHSVPPESMAKRTKASVAWSLLGPALRLVGLGIGIWAALSRVDVEDVEQARKAKDVPALVKALDYRDAHVRQAAARSDNTNGPGRL